MNKILLLFFLVSVLVIHESVAQLEVSGEFRARSEYRDGARVLLDSGQQATFVTSQRTRLLTNFKDDRFEFQLTLQNARIWGNDRERANVPNINLAEGWVKYVLSEKYDDLSVKVGRMHFTLDDKRILGLRNWNDIAVSHDLALLQFKHRGWTVITAGGINNDGNDFVRNAYGENYYKYLGVAWVNKKFSDKLQVSMLNMVDGNEDATDFTKTHARYTSGFYVKTGNKESALSVEASAYYQYGTHTSGLDQKAYLISVVPTYEISKRMKLMAGLNMFSGNDQSSDNATVNRSFNKLFGDGHRYYGYMDYFLNIESNTKGVGVNELFFSSFYKTGEKSELEFSVHNFAVGGVMVDPVTDEVLDANLGTEIDLQFKHKINDYLSARLTYSAMFAESSMETLKGGDHTKYQQWAMVMLVAKPQLFSTK